MQTKSKAKVTLSIDTHLISAIDAIVEQSGVNSRSAMVEEILREWYKWQQQIELEHQTEAYYHSLSEAEREENRQWAKIASEQAKHLWNR
ncbi:MAG: ribbon-helix-helix protein, CopG family [Candidatus Latescibacteria bacterium]|nr:ribbon-helix-helix protein, CopG family [Candidatus Latescibacterota bacterium]